MNTAVAARVLHFGKLPSRGDFVRSGQPAVLIRTLDAWLSRGIEAAAGDPRWKLLYDRAAPTRFAFLGTRSHKCLAGQLVASRDASGRRFPFIAAAALDVADPLAFLARSPLMLARPWLQLEAATRRALTATDAAPVLSELGQTEVEIEPSVQAFEADYRRFVDTHTIGSLEHSLHGSGHAVGLRTLLLGLGLLLQPVLTRGTQRLDKGLTLPLPQDPLLRTSVATLWLDLVAGFLARGAFEIVLLVSRPDEDAGPVLDIGFDGPAPRLLHALIDREYSRQVFIDTTEADWVEGIVEQDHALRKLSAYLDQPALSLQQVAASFKETFLGR